MSKEKPRNPVTKSSAAVSDQDYYASGSYALPEPRALRGGGWDYHPSNIGSANRHGTTPSSRRFNYGFRIVRTKK